MMQRGVETTDMDVRWVSSLSWYFLNLFGLTSVYTLILGDASGADGLQDMQQMQMMGQPQPLQQPAEVLKVGVADLDIQERGGVYGVGRL
jgi:ER membrane protein complex subunit 3